MDTARFVALVIGIALAITYLIWRMVDKKTHPDRKSLWLLDVVIALLVIAGLITNYVVAEYTAKNARKAFGGISKQVQHADDKLEKLQETEAQNDAQLSRDMATMFAYLKEHERLYDPYLTDKYPFGYFLIGPTEEGYARLPIKRKTGDVTAMISIPQFSKWVYFKDANVVRFSITDFDVEIRSKYGTLRNKPLEMVVALPLKKGAKLVFIGSRIEPFAPVVEIMDDNPNAPIFAFGIKAPPPEVDWDDEATWKSFIERNK